MDLTSEISKAHFQIGAVFINKPQIWVLNNYILAWNTRVQCRQALSVAALHIWCRHGVTQLLRRNKSNLGIRLQAFRSSSSHQRWKDDPIFTRVLLLALSFSRRFPLLFFYPPSLSFCQSARLFTKCSFGSLGKKSLSSISWLNDYCLLLISNYFTLINLSNQNSSLKLS